MRKDKALRYASLLTSPLRFPLTLWRWARGEVLLLLCLLLAACAPVGQAPQRLDYVPQPPFAQHQELTSFTQFGVHVTLAVERDQAGVAILASTFTPNEPGFHLYSKDMPRDGIDGAGRPTLVELPPNGPRAIGVVSADQPIEKIDFPGFSQPFSVYPDGAVTLRQPLDLSGLSGQTVQLSITYMACSSRGLCLPPVENRAVLIQVP